MYSHVEVVIINIMITMQPFEVDKSHESKDVVSFTSASHLEGNVTYNKYSVNYCKWLYFKEQSSK